jgi:predicted molibdopterin-dependent oxidoreductase YjgC
MAPAALREVVAFFPALTERNALAEQDRLELTAQDAAASELAGGELASVESRCGRTQARVALSERIAEGTAFLSFHHPETHANAVTGPQRDPESQCPDYQVIAVRVRPAIG